MEIDMTAFFDKMDSLKPVYDVTYKVVLFVCKLLLVGDILLTSCSVLGRYVSFIPDPPWTEEIVLTLMCYMAVLSAALAIRKKTHIRMTAFDRYLPHGVLKFLDVLADVAVFILAIIMVIVGWQFASSIGSMGTYVSIPTLSRFWKYFPIPVAGIAMFIFELEALYNHLKDICLGNDPYEKREEDKRS